MRKNQKLLDNINDKWGIKKAKKVSESSFCGEPCEKTAQNVLRPEQLLYGLTYTQKIRVYLGVKKT